MLGLPAVLWLAYTGREWRVLVKSPDANIRVDLLVIWPLIANVSPWALLHAAKGWRLVTRKRR